MVLAESFVQHHPEATLDILVVDSNAPGVDPPTSPGHGVGIVHPDELDIDRRTYHDMAMIYDVTEMSTAVKPPLLRLLLERYGEPVAYLDPDLEFFAPIDEAFELAASTPIVLTPHVLTPVPRDGLRLREIDIQLCGQFNLGFITVGPGAEPFLDWWGERTRYDALNDTANGLFTDQKWVDFVPSLFDHVVVRDPGWNVAYWNLHERPITRDDAGRLLAGGAPLRFLHLSGYDAHAPHLLSKHTLDNPRVLLSEQPVLAELTAAYGEKLLRINDDRLIPYGYGTLAGRPIPGEIRRMYRDALVDPDPADPPPPEAFGPEGDAPILAWLRQPVVASPHGTVNRLMRMFWRLRPHLQHDFPDLAGDGAKGLQWWIERDHWFIDRYGHLLDDREPAAPVARTLQPGVNVVGYLSAELGVGEAGRLVARAAEHAGVPHATFTYGATLSRQSDPFDAHGSVEASFPYDLDVYCVNADSLPRLLADLPDRTNPHRRRVGMWFWEVETFPAAFHSAFALVDEVWTGSDFIAEAIRPHTDRPVRVFPFPVVPPPPTALTRADVGLPDDRFVFGFHFDAFSVCSRKNPEGVLAAYLAAFGPDDGTHLHLKVINGDSARVPMEQLRHMAKGRPDVQIVDRYLSRLRMAGLNAHIDAYVSLHRSEGLGLTMAYAMAAGKPVIATGYSGNLTFMDESNSLLVPYSLVPVGHGNAPYPPDARWAEPDLDAAVGMMRRLVDDPALGRRLGEQARADIATRHDPDRAGRWLQAEMARLRRS